MILSRDGRYPRIMYFEFEMFWEYFNFNPEIHTRSYLLPETIRNVENQSTYSSIKKAAYKKHTF